MRSQWISALVLLAISLGVIFIYHLYLSPPLYREGSPETGVLIPEGLSTIEIARSLRDSGIIDNPIVFVWLARLLGLDRKLKAGRYNLQRGMAELDCVKIVSKGGIESLPVTVPEGLTIEATARLLERELQIDGRRFRSLCADSQVIERFGLEVESLEGYLFPDTYRFGWGMEEEEVLEVMVDRCKMVFAEEWMKAGRPVDLSRYEVLTLASIIEGETLMKDESPLISAVFHNRLRLDRPLQADPTIQYILREHKPRILYKHLKIDSPYNTYLYRGLPPSPICSPGRMSMRAAMSPAPVDYLYFVAEGNGRHIFSRTLQEHNHAKRTVRSRQ